MEKEIPIATHDGELKIGEIIIPCVVLDDGTRVITQRGMYHALGRSGGTGSLDGKNDAQELPRFLAPKNIKTHVSKELACAAKPIVFRQKGGRRTAYGYKAEILPDVCSVYLEARDAGDLLPSQLSFANQCDALIRSFAKVGIVALVDEATGYQSSRERNELEKLLAIYLTEERLRWAKTFPDEFYKQIYRLKGWGYPTAGAHRTPYIGKITNQVVYEKLPPGVLGKLKEKNPVIPETKRRKWKNFQFLSDDIGQPDLRNHLLQVIVLMRASTTWAKFKQLFARAFPATHNQQIDLPGVFDQDSHVDVDNLNDAK